MTEDWAKTEDTRSPEEVAGEAIQAAIDYAEYKQRAEDAKRRRDELSVLAWTSGVNEHDGWRFSPVAPSQTVTWESISTYDDTSGTDHMGGFIKWYRANCPLKVSKSLFEDYLGTVTDDDAVRAKILADIVVSDGDGSVRMTAPKKEASE